MNRYGQTITWGTTASPAAFTGVKTGYTYRDVLGRLLDDDESGEFRALVQHSRKANLNFSAKITDGSTDFLDLSAGAAIAVSGIAAGVVLCNRAVEKWTLNQPKTATIQAMHFPDMVQVDPALAGTDLDAVTPDQSALTVVTPGGSLIYSTYGMTHAVGVIHELEITQELTINEDDPSPAGTILGATTHGYMRTIRLNLLATGARPAPGTTLALTGAPGHAADYKIESSDEVYAEKRGKMFEVLAIWIPPFTA